MYAIAWQACHTRLHERGVSQPFLPGSSRGFPASPLATAAAATAQVTSDEFHHRYLGEETRTKSINTCSSRFLGSSRQHPASNEASTLQRCIPRPPIDVQNTDKECCVLHAHKRGMMLSSVHKQTEISSRQTQHNIPAPQQNTTCK